MANAAQDRLFEIFVQIAGEQVSSLTSMVDTSQQLAGSLSDVVKQINVTKSSATQTATQGASAHSEAASGPLGVVEGIASTVLHNALGAVPLVRGILSLFGGGDSKPPEPTLLKHILPPAVNFQAAESGAGFTSVDFDQMGQARAFDGRGSERIQERPPVPEETTQAGMPVPLNQINVHVQAMDARSFLDRSSEIAAAVRHAMLNLNSINDVVNDL